MEKRITDIHCLSCGAPAKFDIVRQQYVCGYCGGTVSIGEARQEKQGFRKIQRDRLNSTAGQFRLFSASCQDCGAELVFEENEALSVCPFCQKTMVRTDYLKTSEMPEFVIPFAITADEAKDLLAKWCADNKAKPEARKLKKDTENLQGFYLPYELVLGPVHMSAERMDGNRRYDCEGFINEEFISCSSQTDNLLLDGMEPFDVEAVREFEFGYIAGQRVKIADIGEKELNRRILRETEQAYIPAVRRVLETKAVSLSAGIGSAIRLPVLLPVYYYSRNGLKAAVNGQTGKVSVRSLKDPHYYFLPWWLKGILAAVIITAAVFGCLCLFGMGTQESLYISGLLAAVYLIVFLCLYSDTVHNAIAVTSGPRIYTSGEQTFVRTEDGLVQRDQILERKREEPVFFENIEGEDTPVVLKFMPVQRVILTILLTFTALFLPVIIALFLNGFDFARLNLGGSAVWFCIAVPTVPVYLVKFGIAELHDRPWIYVYNEDGSLRRHRKKLSFRFTKNTFKTILSVLFTPPECLAVWFGLLCFFMCCWLTAFGFG